MGTVDLRTNIHKMVDRIEDERLLRAINSFLEVRENSAESQVWNSLTQDQKKEVLDAYEESETDSNLIADKDIWKNL